EGVVFVRQALGGAIADQMVVPQDVGVGRSSANGVLCRLAAVRWVADILVHRPCDAGPATGADVIYRRQLAPAGPSVAGLHSGEGLATAATDGDGDGSGGSSTAVVPLGDGRIVGAGTERQIGAEAGPVDGIGQLVRS